MITLVPLFPFFQVMALAGAAVLGLWFVYQFFSGALSLAWGTGPGGGTAWWAHIGGFAFGVIAMKLFGLGRRSEPGRSSRAEPRQPDQPEAEHLHLRPGMR